MIRAISIEFLVFFHISVHQKYLPNSFFAFTPGKKYLSCSQKLNFLKNLDKKERIPSEALVFDKEQNLIFRYIY